MSLVLGALSTILRLDDEDFGRRLGKAESDFHATGEKLKAGAAIVGAAVGAAIGAGLAMAIDATAAKAKLTAQLGGDAQYAADMGRVAGRVYARGFGEDLGEINEALRSILSSGLIDEDAADADIERVTVKAKALADVFNQDVSAAARAAGQMVRTGLAKDADEALDIITRGMQQSGNLADDLLDTYSEYGTQWRKLGLDGAMATGLLVQGVKAGARDIDIVADAIKEFSIRAVDGSKLSAQGFKDLGLNAEKMTAQFAKGGDGAKKGLDVVLDRLRAVKDPAQQAQIATALFGTQAEDLGAALFALDPSQATARLGDVAGAADQLGKTLEQSSSQQLDVFKRKAQQALVDKMAEALPTLMAVGGWIERNSDFVGALTVVLGTIAGIIGIVTIATKAWAIAQMALNVAMMLNPIGLIILIVIGLIAVFVGLWMKFEGFRNFWKATWDFILAVFQTWWSVFSGFWIGVWDFVIAAAQAWWSVFSGFWSMIGSFFAGLLQGWWSLFTGFWGAIFSGVASAYGWVVDKVSAFVSFVGSLPGKIAAKTRGLWDGIKESFRAAINWMIGRWNNFSLTLGGGSVLGIGIPSVKLTTPDIPYLATGGDVLNSGLAVIHQGERVVPAAKVSRAGGLADPGGWMGFLRVILQWPDGRIIRDQLVDAASLRGQSTGRYLGVSTT